MEITSLSSLYLRLLTNQNPKSMICNIDYYDRIHDFLERFPQYKERIDQLHFEFIEEESILNDSSQNVIIYTREYVYHKDCILKGTAKLKNYFKAEILYILTPLYSLNNFIRIKFLVKLENKEGLFLVSDGDFIFD